MQTGELKDILAGKYIICSCEGNAEEAIIDLLLDNDKLCFKREDMVFGKCTQIRKGKDIAREYLHQEYGRDVVILRILDREKESLKLPRPYTLNNQIKVASVVTSPEIEILHIIAEGRREDFDNCRRHQKKLSPSEYCNGHLLIRRKGIIRNVKSAEFVKFLYAENIDRLIGAIEIYHRNKKQEAYSLWDLLIR